MIERQQNPKKTPRRLRVTIAFPADVMALLEARAASTTLPIARIIELAVLRYFELPLLSKAALNRAGPMEDRLVPRQSG